MRSRTLLLVSFAACLLGPLAAGPADARTRHTPVLAVIAEDSTLVIGLGERAGLAVGDSLTVQREAEVRDSKGQVVYKGTKPVATYVVVNTERSRALAAWVSGDLPREGDQVKFEDERTPAQPGLAGAAAASLVTRALDEWNARHAKTGTDSTASPAIADAAAPPPPVAPPAPAAPGTVQSVSSSRMAAALDRGAIRGALLPDSVIAAQQLKAAADAAGLVDVSIRTATPRHVSSRTQHGFWQLYANGRVYWCESAGAHVLRGILLKKWMGEGSEMGALGFPVSDETPCTSPDPQGRFQVFEGGRIYWTLGGGPVVFMNPTKVGEGGNCTPVHMPVVSPRHP